MMKKELITTVAAFLVTGVIGFLFNFFFFDYPETRASIRLVSNDIATIGRNIEEIKSTQREIMHLLAKRMK